MDTCTVFVLITFSTILQHSSVGLPVALTLKHGYPQSVDLDSDSDSGQDDFIDIDNDPVDLNLNFDFHVNVNVSAMSANSSKIDRDRETKKFELFLLLPKPEKIQMIQSKGQQPALVLEPADQRRRAIGGMLSSWKNRLGSSIENIQAALRNPIDLLQSHNRGEGSGSGSGELKRWEKIATSLKNDTLDWMTKVKDAQLVKYGVFSAPSSSSSAPPSSSSQKSQAIEEFVVEPGNPETAAGAGPAPAVQATELDQLLQAVNTIITGDGPSPIKLPLKYLAQRFKDLNLTLDLAPLGIGQISDKLNQKLEELSLGSSSSTPIPMSMEEESEKAGEKHSFITISDNGNGNGNGFTAGKIRPPFTISGNPQNGILDRPLGNPFLMPSWPQPQAARPNRIPSPPPMPVQPPPQQQQIFIPVPSPPQHNNNYQQYNHYPNPSPNPNPNPIHNPNQANNNPNQMYGDKYFPYQYPPMPPVPNLETDETNYYPGKGDDGKDSNITNSSASGGIFNLNFNLIKLSFNFNFQYMTPPPNHNNNLPSALTQAIRSDQL